MAKVLIGELKQETATFNPAPTVYDDFSIFSGPQLLDAFRNTKTELAGAMDVFARDDLEVAPTIAASAVSGGRIAQADLERLIRELLDAADHHSDIDGVYLCLHGAMAGEREDDPEGLLLTELRKRFPHKPIVASIDLHAILTDRMLQAADILTPYHTYPHTDHYETGQRAARLLIRMLNGNAQPTAVRVALPMLVRGDELLTATGQFGKAIRMCQAIEASNDGLAAGVIIGNAFTDVSALQSNVLVTTDNDRPRALAEATRIGRFMWEQRHRFQAKLTALENAIQQAERQSGLTVFSDAADATASGASGDSNAILRGLLAASFAKQALLPIVDAPAVEKAFALGENATANFALGGTRDTSRFTPLEVTAQVLRLFDGEFAYEDGTLARSGRVAVLQIDSITVMTTERPVYVVGQRVFTCHDLNPIDFDLVVVKSPNGFRTWYEPIASLIVPVDVPGSTSANLLSLPFTNCVRPIFPLERETPSPFTNDNTL